MTLVVEYTSQLRKLVGIPSEEVAVSGSVTFAELLGELISRHGEAFRDFVVDSEGQLRPTLWVCFDDRHVYPTNTMDLGAVRRVTFLAAISGG